MTEIDEEIKEKIDHLSTLIVEGLKKKNSIFMNMQIQEEFSQYDVFFCYNFEDWGMHQRGILANDLLIGIVGHGAYGFRTDIPDTDPSYYAEKLGIHSNFLSFLFNDVRRKLKEQKSQ